KIKRARIHRAHAGPRLASIFRTKNSTALAAQIVERTDPAFITLHNCHHHLGIAGADCQTDPAGLPGKTAAEFLPGAAAVRAFENSSDIFAAGHARAGSETPWRPLARI